MENNILNGKNSKNLNQKNSSFFEEKASSSNSLEPRLRFKEFNNNWNKSRLNNICTFFSGGTPQSGNPKYYGGNIPFIRSGEIHSAKTELSITEEALKNSSAKLVNKGDLLYALYGATSGEVGISQINGAINQAILCIRSDRIDVRLLAYLLFFKKENIINTYLQGSQGNLSAEIIKNIELFFPNTQNESKKLIKFFEVIDKRIEKQRQLIENLKKYKRGLLTKIFRLKNNNWECKKLGELCDITTGKLDANAMKPNGQYRFYTCAKEFYFIDEFAFDTDALLVSGNGANVGYIHHYKGKFNAYQRTYVLDKFKQNIIFIKYYLETFLHQRIESEKKASNTPYIVLSTLSDLLIRFPTLDEQNKIASFLYNIDKNIEQKNEYLHKLEFIKKGLLQQMFI